MGYGREVSRNKAKSREIHEHFKFYKFQKFCLCSKRTDTHTMLINPFLHIAQDTGIIDGDTQFIFCRLSVPMETDNMPWNLLIFSLVSSDKKNSLTALVEKPL